MIKTGRDSVRPTQAISGVHGAPCPCHPCPSLPARAAPGPLAGAGRCHCPVGRAGGGLGTRRGRAILAGVDRLLALAGVAVGAQAGARGVLRLRHGLAYIIPGRWETFAAAIGAAGPQGVERDLWTLLFFASYALPFAIYAALDRWLVSRAQALPPTARALLRASVLAGLVCGLWSPFPYTPAVAAVDFIGFAQWASVGGEPLLLTLLLWPGMLLAELIRARPGWRESTRSMLPLLAVLVGLTLAGHARIAAMDAREARARASAMPPAARRCGRPAAPPRPTPMSRAGPPACPRPWCSARCYWHPFSAGAVPTTPRRAGNTLARTPLTTPH